MIRNINTAEKLNTPGKRIRALRNFCSLSRKEFAAKHDLSDASLRSWELDILNLSERSLTKLVEAFANEGLVCQKEWILTGTGFSPLNNINLSGSIEDSTTFYPLQSKEVDIDSSMKAESDFFLSFNSSRITALIEEDSLEPLFFKGDIVGGQRIKPADIVLFESFFFLVGGHYFKEKIVVSKLSYAPLNNLYILSRPTSNIMEYTCTILCEKDISLVVPITWVRRKNPYPSVNDK